VKRGRDRRGEGKGREEKGEEGKGKGSRFPSLNLWLRHWCICLSVCLYVRARKFASLQSADHTQSICYVVAGDVMHSLAYH